MKSLQIFFINKKVFLIRNPFELEHILWVSCVLHWLFSTQCFLQKILFSLKFYPKYYFLAFNNILNNSNNFVVSGEEQSVK